MDHDDAREFFSPLERADVFGEAINGVACRGIGGDVSICHFANRVRCAEKRARSDVLCVFAQVTAKCFEQIAIEDAGPLMQMCCRLKHRRFSQFMSADDNVRRVA